MSDFLQEMTEAGFARARAIQEDDAADLESRAASAPPPAQLDPDPSGFDIIAEVKLSSPSEGRLVEREAGIDRVTDLARSYVAHGAAALSVLTEPSRFSGSMDHLEAIAGEVAVPVMRKDFLVDPIQVTEARAGGASGVLLIARMLTGELLEEMADLAVSHGMFVLVEIFDLADVERASVVFDREVLLGVNCRDLSTLGVDTNRFETIAPHLPGRLPAVAESGMLGPDDVASAAALGYRMALVGTSLVSDPDPAGKLESFLQAGRDASTGVVA